MVVSEKRFSPNLSARIISNLPEFIYFKQGGGSFMVSP